MRPESKWSKRVNSVASLTVVIDWMFCSFILWEQSAARVNEASEQWNWVDVVRAECSSCEANEQWNWVDVVRAECSSCEWSKRAAKLGRCRESTVQLVWSKLAAVGVAVFALTMYAVMMTMMTMMMTNVLPGNSVGRSCGETDEVPRLRVQLWHTAAVCRGWRVSSHSQLSLCLWSQLCLFWLPHIHSAWPHLRCDVGLDERNINTTVFLLQCSLEVYRL